MRKLHINGMTPTALGVTIALREKALEFELVEHGWEATSSALGDFGDDLELVNSLEGEFPILTDGDARLTDSFFTLEYLDETYAEPPLRPADAYGQWRVQAFARFLGERVLPAVSTLGIAEAFADLEQAPDAASRFASTPVLTSERREAWVRAIQGPVDAELVAESHRKLELLVDRIAALLGEGGPWLLGRDYTISDIAAFALLHSFIAGPLSAGPVQIGATARAWHDRVAARPAVSEALKLRTPAFLPGPEHARWG